MLGLAPPITKAFVPTARPSTLNVTSANGNSGAMGTVVTTVAVALTRWVDSAVLLLRFTRVVVVTPVEVILTVVRHSDAMVRSGVDDNPGEVRSADTRTSTSSPS